VKRQGKRSGDGRVNKKKEDKETSKKNANTIKLRPKKPTALS